MPTRKVSERERLTLWARNAEDAQLEEALEILRIEVRARATKPAKKAEKVPANKAATKAQPPKKTMESPASSQPGGEVPEA